MGNRTDNATGLICEEVDLPADPLVVFRALAHGGARRPFLLETAGAPARGRYSMAGCDPLVEIEFHGDRGRVRFADGREEGVRGNPFDCLQSWIDRLHASGTDRSRRAAGGPPMLGGGAVLALGYDLCHHIERLPRTTRDDSAFGDLHAAFYDTTVIFDHVQGRCFVTACSHAGDVRQARARADALHDSISRAAEHSQRSPCGQDPPSAPNDLYHGLPGPALGELESNFSPEGYERAVARALDYIAAGDIFQVNLSQRFACDWHGAPDALYAALRAATPAPFAALLDLDRGRWVLSASPERFLRTDGLRVRTQPIKGTRPRGETPALDAALARELIESAKDAAELAMIIDLERNDLGRVCAYGSVRVSEAAALESHPTVHHRVATVEGTLRTPCRPVDLLRAAFPGGSITGAPKIRAMEIIDELEPTARKLYTGAIGYVSRSGDLDLNIAIRTILLDGRRATFQAGAGIVADSDPAAEYEETLHKGRALARALGRSIERPEPAGRP